MKHKQELIKILGLADEASWAEIYEAIGALKEKNTISYLPSNKPGSSGTKPPHLEPPQWYCGNC